MTIASAIVAKQQQVVDSYTAVSNKGGTLPATQNLTNLATAISTIPSGGSSPVITSLSVTPTTSAQTITVPSGTDGYSPVNVSAVTASIDANITAGNIKKNVSILGVMGTYEGSSVIGREVVNGKYQMPVSNFTFSLPSNITDVGRYALYYAFKECTSLTSVNLSSLTTVSGSYAFSYAFHKCTNLTSVDLSSLTTVSGSYGLDHCFYQCYGLLSVDLSSLTTVSGGNGLNSIFFGCTSLTSVNLSSLTTVSKDNGLTEAFHGTALVSMSFPSLTNVSVRSALSYAFSYNTKIENISFPALTTTSFGSYTNQFTNMMQSTGTTVTHTIHFPSNLQSTISGLTGYPLFGGTSGYVTLSFDLPATS